MKFFAARLATMVIVATIQFVSMKTVSAQPAGFNYDESKVRPYTLPDPLLLDNGRRVTTSSQWEKQRRPELLETFIAEMYGRSPGKSRSVKAEVTSVDKSALGGKAIRKEVTLTIKGPNGSHQVHLLIYLPPAAKKPVPMFLGLNFDGNHSINPDPGITLAMLWVQTNKGGAFTAQRAPESSRGKSVGRWDVETILSRGYAVATVYAGDIEPDYNNSYKNGVHALYFKDDQSSPEPDEWGTVAAWAWGLSRVMDYFAKDKDIDAKKVIVTGHSRMGKAALWAGATDQRFAIVISNNSGEGGAALARRWFGETTARINTSFPHWFSGNFKKYNDRENDLPFDQHELIALIAPRPVYIASAQEDQWADPKGEFLSGFHAAPVYKLYGKKGLGVTEQPPINQAVGDFIGYHIRTGKHDVTDFDWAQYLDFADRHFARSKK